MLNLADPFVLTSRCLIDGQWVGEGSVAVTNPADGAEVARVPAFAAAETETAVAAADRAFPRWSAMTGRQRGVVLRNWARLIEAHAGDLAAVLTAEEGKPLAEARAEVLSAASYFAFFADEAERIGGEIIQAPRRDSRIFVQYRPIGVVAAITPWNFPSSMVARKLAPALAAGCTVVLKPAPETPLSSLALAELGHRAGLPDGVLNVVTGDASEIGAVLTSSPVVRFISFTGSTRVGRLLMEQAASTVKKLGLELGGHAPFIVLPDADLDAAVAGAFAAKFRNMGQTCVCPNRFFIHESLHRQFVEKLAAAVSGLVVGDGREADVTQGPLINERAVEKVEQHIVDALQAGARLVAGGKRHSLGGTFFEPTILDEVTDGMMTACEETFGPIAAISSFTDIEDVVGRVNASPYGLAGYLYGRDIGTLLPLAERLSCGMIGINAVHLGLEVAPIGGFKQSGLGREGSHHGILEYCEMQYLLVGVGS